MTRFEKLLTALVALQSVLVVLSVIGIVIEVM